MVANMKRQNFCMVFGCRPSEGVLANTKMVMDAVHILTTQFDRTTFTVTLVECFDDLKGSDANFEMVASNTLQQLKMVYCHNIATETVAVIFSNSEAKGFAYDEVKERT